MEEVKALLQMEEDTAKPGPGKKAVVVVKRGALKDQPAPRKHKKEQPPGKINSFFKPLNVGTFPPPAGSPALKVKSPSAVFGAAFIETGVIPRN